jgi:hypothetical protein
MMGFLLRAQRMIRSGRGEDLCGEVFEALLCQHEERVFRAVEEMPPLQCDWPGREGGERCPIVVDGLRCDYWSDADEIMVNPEALRARQARHKTHGGRRRR